MRQSSRRRRTGIRNQLGREIATVSMTIRDPDAVKRLIDTTQRALRCLDALINNGGGQFPQAAIDFSVKGWLAVIDTNLNGTWYMMQAAAQYWREQSQSGKHRQHRCERMAWDAAGCPYVRRSCGRDLSLQDRFN